ncbi:MAG: ribonuclease HII [Deltaproteobacteria bacterium]|nr:ribonuclease HII [Deltaproteobacteria bacterium]
MRVLQKKLRPTLEFENAAYSRGFSKIAGIDEAGRGPLAGPVVVAAVILGNNWNMKVELNDSKQLTYKKRQELYDLICEESSAFKIISISPQDIDRLNILQATLLGMKRCSALICPEPDYLLVDGNRYPDTNICGQTVVKGDCLSKSIAAASILAKVTRDRKMVEFGAMYPKWGFERHKGYPTRKHREAITEHGLSPIHRRSFRL